MIKEGQHEGSRGAAPPDRTLPALHVSHSGTQPRSYLLGWNPERPPRPDPNPAAQAHSGWTADPRGPSNCFSHWPRSSLAPGGGSAWETAGGHVTVAPALSLVALPWARAAAGGKSDFRRRERCFRGGQPGRGRWV